MGLPSPALGQTLGRQVVRVRTQAQAQVQQDELALLPSVMACSRHGGAGHHGLADAPGCRCDPVDAPDCRCDPVDAPDCRCDPVDAPGCRCDAVDAPGCRYDPSSDHYHVSCPYPYPYPCPCPCPCPPCPCPCLFDPFKTKTHEHQPAKKPICQLRVNTQGTKRVID